MRDKNGLGFLTCNKSKTRGGLFSLFKYSSSRKEETDDDGGTGTGCGSGNGNGNGDSKEDNGVQTMDDSEKYTLKEGQDMEFYVVTEDKNGEISKQEKFCIPTNYS